MKRRVLETTSPDIYLIDVTVGGEGGGRWAQTKQVLLEVERGAPTVQLIGRGSDWYYYHALQPPPENWFSTPGSEGETWLAGSSPLGYGEDSIQTTFPPLNPRPMAAFFRKRIFITDPRALLNCRADLLYDDGVALYVNGREAARFNLNAQADASTPASGTKSGSAESAWETVQIQPDFFKKGENLVAVEVHQVSASSSDLTMDFELSVTLVPWITIGAGELATMSPTGFSCQLEESPDLLNWVPSTLDRSNHETIVTWGINPASFINRFYRLIYK